MREILIFRFHKDVDLCKRRVSILKQKNQEMDIYGIGEKIDSYEELYDAGLEHIFTIRDKNNRWKWKNGDLALAKWFEEYGRSLSFDRLYLVEWDMLFTKSIKDIYPKLSPTEIGLTGYKKNLHNKWFTGRTNEKEYIQSRIEEQLDFSPQKEKVEQIIFPGTTLPRPFLKLYSELDIPEVGNDEIRLSIISTLSSYNIRPTNITSDWFSCRSSSLDEKDIKRAVSEGNHVYHPVKKRIESCGDNL